MINNETTPLYNALKTAPQELRSFSKTVAPERSNWRDQWISKRHRDFGWNAPFTDIDFMGFEYDNCVPVALIEYKHFHADIKLSGSPIKTQKYTADNLRLPDGSFGIPFFVVAYYPDHHNYHVIPMNDAAKALPHCDVAKTWTERNFVRLLYFLRKKNCPQEILNEMWNSKLPEGVLPLKITL